MDSTFSESIGWNEISQFVKTFIEEQPEPEPTPKLVDDIDVWSIWEWSLGEFCTTGFIAWSKT